MAAVLVLVGGFFGSLMALVGVSFFDATLWQAMALWSGIGLAPVLAYVAMAMMPRAGDAYDPAKDPAVGRA
jgi:hypothetical protein